MHTHPQIVQTIPAGGGDPMDILKLAPPHRGSAHEAARPAAQRGHAPPAERSEALDLRRARLGSVLPRPASSGAASTSCSWRCANGAVFLRARGTSVASSFT